MKKTPQLRLSMRRAIEGSLCVLVLTAASPSFAKEPKACGDLKERGYNIKAHGLTCERAKEVAEAYDDMLISGMSFPSTEEAQKVQGFSCQTQGTGYESYEVRCAKGKQVITFGWGV